MATTANIFKTAGAGAFRTTHWTVVLSAQPGSPSADRALAELYRHYCYPVYVYIRRRGYNHHDAQDLTQELFSELIDRKSLDSVDRDKGRFRTFLLACVDNCLSNHRQRATAAKRGGKVTFVSWDEELAEDRYLIEACDDLTPEKAFDRRWALTLLGTAFDKLKSEYQRAGKLELFETLHVFLSGEKHPASYADSAARLNMAEPAVRVAVHRLRQRYGKLIRAEIAQTVSDPEQVDEELQYLKSVLTGAANAL